MTTQRWTSELVPDQHGRTAIVTGGNTGLGFEIARILALHGAEVVLASRSEEKARDAADRIQAAVRDGGAGDARVSTVRLDQSSLESVTSAAAELRAGHPRIDLLINNAGMLGSTERLTTPDGLEATFATNHLGVFALTGLLLDRMVGVAGSRVVTMSSVTHSSASMRFDDLQSERRYRRNDVYSESKLANLLFAYELQRRLAATGADTISVAAHPGQSRTEFTRDLSPAARFIYGPRARAFTGWMMQDRSIGVLGAVRAAVALDVRGGEYYGPSGPFQLTGYPERVKSSKRSHDEASQHRLWDESERLTGVRYPRG